MAETFRSKAKRERAFAGKTRNPVQARIALVLAEKLDSLADAYDRLDAARVR